jgi:1-acyl-sn-glycerol-3-phosphate acyltransferase
MAKLSPEHMAAPRPVVYDLIMQTAIRGMMARKGGVYAANGKALREIKGGYIIAPPHRSVLDIGAAAATARDEAGVQVQYLGKPELWRPKRDETHDLPSFIMQAVKGQWYRLFGAAATACGAIPIDRERSIDGETMDRLGRVFENGGVVGIFPEGTRGKGNTIERRKVKRGAAMLAMQHGVPIATMGIAGSGSDVRGPIVVAVGEIVEVDQVDISGSENFRANFGLINEVTGQVHAGMQAAQNRAAYHNSELQ